MRYLIAVSVFLASLFTVGASAQACGFERWSAKVLADGTSLFGPYATSVESLRSMSAPADPPFGPRTVPERNIYRVHAELLGFGLEDDGDIHLIIAQLGHRDETMIAEIPDPKCMQGAPDQYVSAVRDARLAFLRTFGVLPIREYRLAYAPITLTGPLFFDYEHGQSGASPNDSEIHPVLRIETEAVPYSSAPTETRPQTPTSANGQCPGDVLVWVNTRSGIYHLPGSRWYGSTRQGQYMCRKDADAAGYRVAANE